jgi:hypothetical protein
MAPAATRRRLACRARRVRRERGRRAGGAWVRRTRSDGRAPRSCVRSARFVSSAIRVGIPEADWADLGAAAELTPSGARDARSGRRTSCPVELAVQQSDDPLAGESSTRHGSAQRLATVPLRYESGRDGRRSRLGRRAAAQVETAPPPRRQQSARAPPAIRCRVDEREGRWRASLNLTISRSKAHRISSASVGYTARRHEAARCGWRPAFDRVAAIRETKRLR